MERVGVLINKLQEQLAQKASVENMIITAQMLHTELLQHKNNGGIPTSKVAVMVPSVVSVPAPVSTPEISHNDHDHYKPVIKPEPEPAPIPEPMPEPVVPASEPTPSPTPKPEPEPIPQYLEGRPWDEIFNLGSDTKHWHSEAVIEAPTLAHQEKIIYELNDTMGGEEHSLNDKLKEQKAEMVSMLQETPIRDLKKAISINDRHRFINELFRGDETMYERSIKTINGFNIYAEAEYWIQRELKVKLGWNTTLDLVKTFDQLVRRRFS
ncbi:hypothetical protein [Aridibaculum aurantiacum]|uniref:hypothetical protein n=1 Tax=Aridibaculum aurantiacum TaxID=2810307 RepID=UPI001A97A907|nr:hypothetical protein [Aridibaculum aurantiacum]